MIVCFLPIILNVKFVRCTSRGPTGGRSFLIHFLLRCMPLFFSRERFSRSFPSSTVKSNFFVYQRFHRSPLVGYFYFYLLFCREEKSQLPGFELTSQRVRTLLGYQLSYRSDRCKSRFPLPNGDFLPYWTPRRATRE